MLNVYFPKIRCVHTFLFSFSLFSAHQSLCVCVRSISAANQLDHQNSRKLTIITSKLNLNNNIVDIILDYSS